MKRGLILFLKILVLLIAVATAAYMIWFPTTEGRAANLDLISIYKDPVIIYMYIASIPFFVLLYQAFKLLGYIDQNKIFSQKSVIALRNIKYCAIAIIGFILGGEAFLILSVTGEDKAGPMALGIYISIAFAVVAIATAYFQRRLQKSVNHKKAT